MVSLTELPEMAAGYKSLKRSITKSAKFLRETLEELKDTDICVYGAIQGALEVDLRTLAAEE
jgi:queuine tRNA-ribosyltransferase subunit QTRTD1